MKLKKIIPFLYPLIVIAVFVFAFIGYYQALGHEFHFWGVLFSTLSFFLADDGDEGRIWAGNPANTLEVGYILVAKYLALILVGLGLFSVFFKRVKETFSVYKIRFFYKRHIIIFSLDALGYRISKELLSSGYRVVVVETNRESPFIEEIENAGGLLIHSNPFESKTLDQIGLSKCRACILANDKDEENIEIAGNISVAAFEIKKKKLSTDHDAMKLFIHITDQQNNRVIKDYSDIDTVDDHYDLHSINIEQIAAQKVYDDFPPHLYFSSTDTNSNNSIAVIGCDKTAEAFLLENIILSHYQNHQPLKIFLIDKNVDEFFNKFSYQYPFYHSFIELIPVKLLNANFYNNFTSSTDYIEDLYKIKVAYFFGNCDSTVINMANSFQQFIYNKTNSLNSIPLIVSLPEESAIFDFMNNGSIHKNQIKNLFTNNLNHHFIKRKSDSFTGKGIIEEGELNDMISRVINFYYTVCYEFESIIQEKLNIIVSPQVIEQLSGYIIDYPFNHTDFTEIEFEKDVLQYLSQLTEIPISDLLKFATIKKNWNTLHKRKKESNRYAARHIQVKMFVLNAIGCTNLTRENIEKYYPVLAKLEHSRWSGEKMVFNYQFGSFPADKREKYIVKEVLKIHDQLIPYEELSPGEKYKDLNLFLLIPLLQKLKNSVNKF